MTCCPLRVTIRRFLLPPHTAVVSRTVFLVDGFNLYHSVRAAQRRLRGNPSTKWLGIRRLCQQQLHVVGTDERISGIHYFSALATHLEGVVA